MVEARMSLNRSIAVAAALAGVLAVGAPVARAQGSSAAQASSNGSKQAVTSADVNDQEMEQFTRAYLAVKDAQEKEKTDLQGATDPAKQQEIKNEANRSMAAAIKDHQLTVDRFNAILKAIPSDDALGKRFVEWQTKIKQEKPQ
jgi:hypothetical protein